MVTMVTVTVSKVLLTKMTLGDERQTIHYQFLIKKDLLFEEVTLLYSHVAQSNMGY